MMTEANNFAEFVRKGRQKRGWSLQELANRTGLSRGYINLIEQGNREPPEATANKIRAALSGQEIDIIDLVSGHLTKEQAQCLRLFTQLPSHLREHYVQTWEDYIVRQARKSAETTKKGS